MKIRQKSRASGEDLRLSPENRLCAKFDAHSLAKFRVGDADLGFRVVDNCAEEHIM